MKEKKNEMKKKKKSFVDISFINLLVESFCCVSYSCMIVSMWWRAFLQPKKKKKNLTYCLMEVAIKNIFKASKVEIMRAF